MNIKIVSELMDNIKEVEEEIQYIKKRDFNNLIVKIEMNIQEAYEIMDKMIYDDTQINLLENDILIEDLEDVLSSEEAEDDIEYKYIKDTLCKKYSPGILKDAMQYVFQLACNTESFHKKTDNNGEEIVIFEINLEDFENNDSKIVEYIKKL